MRVRAGIEQLRVDAHAVARALNASFYHIRDSQLLRNLAQIACNAALILQNGGAADDFQVGDLRQVREDFVLHPIGEVSISFVFTSVFKREHRNALVEDTQAEVVGRRAKKKKTP